MSKLITHLEIRNYRSLANVNLDIGQISVLFGPNGAGKSSLMDTLWFLRDCAINGVDQAARFRSQGVGLRWLGAEERDAIGITLETEFTRYQVEVSLSAGRIDPFLGEKLLSKRENITLLHRNIGSRTADFYRSDSKQISVDELPFPEKPALTRYIDLEGKATDGYELNQKLRIMRLFKGRGADLFVLQNIGSESDADVRLHDRGKNLWSVLRNLKDRRGLDDRYDTIIAFMSKAFPGDIVDVFIEQTGRQSVYGSFQHAGWRDLIPASQDADGYLQMLLNLTGLFSEGQTFEAILMFDEPDISLHPLALAVFAEAAKLAASKWNKQIFIVTHSPVLMSQFDPQDVYVLQKQENRSTQIKRVLNIPNIQHLLESYSLGSLYMAEMIAPQSNEV